MSLRNWFASKRNKQANAFPSNEGQPVDLSEPPLTDELKHLWSECYSCTQKILKKNLESSLMVCPSCGYHFRISAKQRIEQLCDGFEEFDAGMSPSDPLNFVDTEPYKDRYEQAAQKSKLNEAIITGIAQIETLRFALAVMDFSYLGGSMGSVVGEKITRLIEQALKEQISLVIVSASGGARMQEGTFSLMQMVKTGAALGQFHEAGLLYVSVLTEPTFGGVTASYGTLGDIIIAESGARIGFAGRRVIEQTIRQKLPADFQTAPYLLKYGQVDMVLERKELRQTLQRLLSLHQTSIEKRNPLTLATPL